MKQHIGTIGPSVLIRGELSATDDLTIEGQVEGKIVLRSNAHDWSERSDRGRGRCQSG